MPAGYSSGSRIGTFFHWLNNSQKYPFSISTPQTIDALSGTLSLTAGAPAVSQTQTIVDDGNTIALTAGTPTVTNLNTIVDDGNDIALTFGTPNVVVEIDALSGTIALAAGTPTVTATATIVDDGNTIALTAGAPSVVQEIDALSATINLTAGTPAVFTPIVALSATISLTAGAPTVTTIATIVDNGNDIALTAGSPAVFTPIVDDGNTIALAAGTPTVTNLNTIVDNGNDIALTFGEPLVLQSAQYIIDDGNDIALTAGTPFVYVHISGQSATINLTAGAPSVVTEIDALSAALALAAGTPTVTSLNTIVDDGNDIALTAGTPTVTSFNAIAALAATLDLTAGAPTVTTQTYIQALSAAISLAAGTPSVVTKISDDGNLIALTAGTFNVISPNQLVLLGPSEANIGDFVLVASPNLSDTTRDDNFVSSINPALWTTSSSGSTNIVVNNGVNVELRKTGGGSSYQLQSVAQYLSGDITVEYDITSEYLSDLPASEIVYVGLRMQFATGQTLTIKRVMGPQGQQILVQYFVGGIFYDGASRRTTSSSGKLRLMEHENIVAAVVDDEVEPIFATNVNSMGLFNSQIFSTTNGQNQYIKARYRAYRSHVGVLFGDVFLTDRTLETDDRVEGTVPRSSIVGPVDVRLFNHFGQIAVAPDGFTYPLVLGQSLSSNKGFQVNIQSDPTIR